MILRLWKVFFCCLFCFNALTVSAADDDIIIEWEISNRFSPFEALQNPEKAFDTYRITKDDHNLAGWHERLDKQIGGMKSPYAQNLINKKDLHWDPVLGEHREIVLKYVRKETSTDTKIDVWVNLVNRDDSMCKWSSEVESVACNKRVLTSIPLSGGDVTVEVDGISLSRKLTPKHKVILALGDSYGSGEGNPDVPAKWKNNPWSNKTDLTWLVDQANVNKLPDRRWVDDTCHRSFFSHQSLTALQMASRNPHLFVSFLHYACSGAEIFDGVLAPQWQAWGEGTFVPYSQVNAALRDLCQIMPQKYQAATKIELNDIEVDIFHRRGGKKNRNITGTMLKPGDNFDKSTRIIRDKTKSLVPNSGLFSCDEDNMRKPDHIFLSIGGNDIGFADLVSYFVVPVKFNSRIGTFLLLPDVCPQHSYRVRKKGNRKATEHCWLRDKINNYHSGDLIGAGFDYGMERRYELLFNILKSRFYIEAPNIIMPQMPDPLRSTSPESSTCQRLLPQDRKVVGSEARRYDPMSPWNGLKVVAGKKLLKRKFIKKWQFNITKSESLNLLKQFDDFRVVLSETAAKQNITFVCDTRDAFIGRGWWTGDKINLPNHTKKNGSGSWSVSTWNPYEFTKTGRAIRTGNDSALTQPHPDTAITGTAHPNLIGHTLVADMVINALDVR